MCPQVIQAINTNKSTVYQLKHCLYFLYTNIKLDLYFQETS